MTILANMTTAQQAEFSAAVSASPGDQVARAAITDRRSGKTLPPYLGFVTTRGRIANQINATQKECNSVQTVIARDDISALQLIIATWYQASQAGGSAIDQGIGSATSVAMSVEYPIGSAPQRVTFGGSATPSLPDVTLNVSDILTPATAIPRGAKFRIRIFYSNANGVINNAFGSAAALDGAQFYSTTGNTDQTLNNAFQPTAGGNFIPITAVVGMTQRPTFGLGGDSQIVGTAETAGGPGNDFDIGIWERLVGPNFAYCNMSQGGTQAIDWSTSATALRRGLLRYCSEVASDFGTNDFTHYSAALTEQYITTNVATIKAAPGPAKRYWHSTILPRPSSSSDSFTTVNGQTVDATHNGRLITFNADLRNGAVPGVDGYVELGDRFADQRDSGRWAMLPTIRTVTDGAITGGNNTFTSATAAFKASDVGAGIVIQGAGTGSTPYYTVIAVVTSATTVSLASSPQLTVSGASTVIGNSTNDGVHGLAATYRTAMKADVIDSFRAKVLA